VTRRPDYTRHPAYAEYERLAFVEGDLEAGLAKLCEATGIEAPAHPVRSWLDLVAGERTRPERRDDAVRHRQQGAVDPASPYAIVSKRPGDGIGTR
jgi:hypothetical protein